MATKIKMIDYYWEKVYCLSKSVFQQNNLKQYSLVINYSRFNYHGNEISNQGKFLCLILTACEISNKSNKRLLKYCIFIFSMPCSIAPVMSYLSEMKLKIYKMAPSILLKFLTLKWDISRTIWRIKDSDGSFFAYCHTRSFELNFFRPE